MPAKKKEEPVFRFKPPVNPVRKRVAKKAPVERRKPEHVRLVSGEDKEEWVEALNREIENGWEVVGCFVKKYDYVALLKRHDGAGRSSNN